MPRADRLFDLLQTLRRHRRPVSGATLAQETGVSIRTLYRDIAALKAMGAEIEGEPGMGYVLKPGFLLPPLMFSTQEIEALTLGLRWIARRTDAGMAQAGRNAIAKIAAVLPPDLREKTEDDALLIAPVWEPPQAVDLALLRRALSEERKLALSYRDGNGARTARVVWPTALGFFETTRVLVAWCELRRAFRHFRADRIEAADILPERSPKPRRMLVKEWRGAMLTETDRETRYASLPSRTRRETLMSKDLTLYTNPQSRGRIAHWMLEEVGHPYTVKVLEFGPAMQSPDYLAINPMGKVPAIVHGDTVVTECAAILAYLADAFPEAKLAPEPENRGEYYRWLFFAASCLEPATTNRSMDWNPSPQEEGRFGYGSYDRVLDTLAGTLKGKTYIAGERFSAADVYLVSQLNWGMMMGGIEKRPEFEAYCQKHVSRPAAGRVNEQCEKLMAQQL